MQQLSFRPTEKALTIIEEARRRGIGAAKPGLVSSRTDAILVLIEKGAESLLSQPEKVA